MKKIKEWLLSRWTNHLISVALFRVFIYLKMEHKRNKICRNLYTSGKPRILELINKMQLFLQYEVGKQNYKPISDMCLSLVLTYFL